MRISGVVVLGLVVVIGVLSLLAAASTAAPHDPQPRSPYGGGAIGGH